MRCHATHRSRSQPPRLLDADARQRRFRDARILSYAHAYYADYFIAACQYRAFDTQASLVSIAVYLKFYLMYFGGRQLSCSMAEYPALL